MDGDQTQVQAAQSRSSVSQGYAIRRIFTIYEMSDGTYELNIGTAGGQGIEADFEMHTGLEGPERVLDILKGKVGLKGGA